MLEQFRDFFAGNIFKQALLQSSEAEIEELTGKRYQRNESSCHRWGSNTGCLEIDGVMIPTSELNGLTEMLHGLKMTGGAWMKTAAQIETQIWIGTMG